MWFKDPSFPLSLNYCADFAQVFCILISVLYCVLLSEVEPDHILDKLRPWKCEYKEICPEKWYLICLQQLKYWVHKNRSQGKQNIHCTAYLCNPFSTFPQQRIQQGLTPDVLPKCLLHCWMLCSALYLRLLDLLASLRPFVVSARIPWKVHPFCCFLHCQGGLITGHVPQVLQIY